MSRSVKDMLTFFSFLAFFLPSSVYYGAYLVSEQLRFLDHHPHFGAGVRDAFDFEGAVVPLGQEAVGLFEFTPEEERF